MKRLSSLQASHGVRPLWQQLLLTPLVALLLGLPALAQVATRYTFQESSGSFSNITGGNRLNTTNNSFDNQTYSRTIEPFFFDGNTYTSLTVSANGFITFGSAPAGTNYTPISNTASYSGAISAFGCDLANAASGTREIRHQRVGSEEIFQWRGARRTGQSESIDFQIRLNTDNGVITLRYNNANPGNQSSNYPQVGLRGPNNTFATNVNNRRVDASTGAGSTWANTAAGTANNSVCRYNNQLAGRAPENGQTYTWTPICLPVAATAEAFTNCGANTFSVQVTVTDLGGAAGVNIQAPIGTNVLTNVGLGTHTVGPFTIGQSRTVRVVHPASNLCNLDLGTFTSPTSCITAGTCYNGTPYPFSGNSCAFPYNGRLQAGIGVSGFNNALNSNVVLQRVELIIAHDSRSQVRVNLVSPSGQSRQLISGQGGARQNFGNPSNCPSASFILDDAAAQSVTSVPTGFGSNNVTGSWRPINSLAGFTGDPNGQWLIEICSNNGTAGSLRRVNLVFANLDCAGTPNGSALPGTACNDGDPTTVNDTWTNDCQCQGQPNILYSRSNGDFAANIWSYTPGGPAAGVIPNQHSSIVIRNGHHVTFSGTRQARSFTIESGGSFALGSGTLTVNGTALTNDGSFDGGTGTLILAGGSNVSVGGSEPMDIFNLTVTNTAGATVDATVDVRNALTLSAGTFTANVPVRLVSTASRTGRLAPVAAGASYVGNITVERYVPGGATNWRMFASPVSGATMANWNDDFYTAGFPGSNYPNFYSGGELWPTVRWYNEAHTGAGINDGLTGVSGNGHALTPGQGFAAWSGSNLGGTQAFVVDVTGPPTVAQSPFTLPMSHTNTGTPATDGWNLVGNPLPSPISFAAINRGANVQNAYWVFNPANGNNASYSNGLGTNSANGIIQSSQGFWLKASGPAVTTTLTESAKATQQSGGIFGGQEQVNVPLVRMAISSGINSYRDEALVAFHEGSPALDEDDALKFVFAHPNAPQISTRSSDGHALAINRHGVYSGELAIPVLVDVAVTGTYTITTTDMEHLNSLSCLVLEDLVTGTITPLHEGATYSFTMAANANAEEPRFMLRATAPIPFTFSSAACFGAGGSAQLDVPAGAYGITWSNSAGEVLFSDVTTVEEMPAGNYQVSVSGTGSACGQLVQSFTIAEPFAMEVYVEAGMPSCHDASDATLTLEVLGGVAPYTYLWSNGATTATLQNVGAGSYVVTVTDYNGCTLQPGALVVNAPAPLGGEIVEPEATVVGQAVFFASTAPASSEHSWDFGDGNTSSDWAPVHSYDLPGTYVVALTLRDGECQRSLQTTISVSVSTGLNELDADEVRAYSNGEALVLLSNLGQELHVQVYDAAGRMKTVKRVPAHSNRLEIPTSGWAPGVYFLNASTSWEQWTFTLPVVE